MFPKRMQRVFVVPLQERPRCRGYAPVTFALRRCNATVFGARARLVSTIPQRFDPTGEKSSQACVDVPTIGAPAMKRGGDVILWNRSRLKNRRFSGKQAFPGSAAARPSRERRAFFALLEGA